LYIKNGIELEPLSVGGTGVRSDLLVQPAGMPIHYEAGTQNLPGIASLNAGVNFILETGINKITKKKRTLFEKMMTELKDIPGIKIYGREDDAHRVPIFCFNVHGFEPSDLGYILRNSFDIIVRSGLHCAPLIHKALGTYPNGSVRVSPSYFTTFDEIDQFIQAIKQISVLT
jgi:selenocysteine lyase/cysteine desulfurase